MTTKGQRRVKVTLNEAEMKALQDAARENRRNPFAQAAQYVIDGLQRDGFLPSGEKLKECVAER